VRVAERPVLCQGSQMDVRLAYAGCMLDRATHLRADEALLGGRLREPSTRLIPVWRDRSLIASDNRPRLRVLTGALTQAAVSVAREVVFLGLDEDRAAWFACDLSHLEEEQLGVIGDGAAFEDLGRVVTLIAGHEAALLAYARAITYWHRRHRFCSVCGSPTAVRQGGHSRVCADQACEAQHFPRTDPVVIMLVTRSHNGSSQCLLARQRHWMPGLVSALAGFVEPGETLEEAVCREVREESGLEVDAVYYRASQPWPFPSSLMLGFRAIARNGAELEVDGDELEDARWFYREEVAAIRSLGLRLPFRGTIARALIEAWLAGDEAGRG
jgi:NAD+ diphosphatase